MSHDQTGYVPHRHLMTVHNSICSFKRRSSFGGHLLDYWIANRDILLHGTFRPLHPELNYTSVTAEGVEKSITVLYADLPYTWNGRDCDVFLGGERDGLIFENPSDRSLDAEWYDCFGTPQGAMTITTGSIVRIPVPCTGMISVRR